jgi:hypothetical protein
MEKTFFKLVFALQIALASLSSADLNESAMDILYQEFPLLADLDTPLPGSISGRQNFTRCCLQAVYDSYQVLDNGTISPNPANLFVTLSADQLVNEEFPCGATYNGSSVGAPVVQIPYIWCATNCPGWQRSTAQVSFHGSSLLSIALHHGAWRYQAKANNYTDGAMQSLTQWVQPFVGFILPAAAFCLNVGSILAISELVLAADKMQPGST